MKNINNNNSISQEEINEMFNISANAIKSIKNKPNDEILLKLYSLFKQATIGDINIECPNIYEIKSKLKWESWNKMKGKSKNDAMIEYISLVHDLLEKD